MSATSTLCASERHGVPSQNPEIPSELRACSQEVGPPSGRSKRAPDCPTFSSAIFSWHLPPGIEPSASGSGTLTRSSQESLLPLPSLQEEEGLVHPCAAVLSACLRLLRLPGSVSHTCADLASSPLRAPIVRPCAACVRLQLYVSCDSLHRLGRGGGGGGGVGARQRRNGEKLPHIPSSLDQATVTRFVSQLRPRTSQARQQRTQQRFSFRVAGLHHVCPVSAFDLLTVLTMNVVRLAAPSDAPPAHREHSRAPAAHVLCEFATASGERAPGVWRARLGVLRVCPGVWRACPSVLRARLGPSALVRRRGALARRRGALARRRGALARRRAALAGCKPET
jgi:hypothetical protein